MVKLIRQLLGKQAGGKGEPVADDSLDVYIRDVKGGQASFIRLYDSYLTQYSETVDDFRAWHIFITHLQKIMRFCFSSSLILESLCPLSAGPNIDYQFSSAL